TLSYRRWSIGEMTRLAVFAMPTAIMPKRAIPIAAEVSVEPVSPSEAWPAKRDASEGMVQQRMRYMTEEQSRRNVCGMLKNPVLGSGLCFRPACVNLDFP